MNIIRWNIWGLGSDPTFREAKKLLKMQMFELIFLCEIKLTSRQMQGKSKRLNFDNYFEVNRSRKSGGLALMWSSGLLVKIKSWSMHYIVAVICAENGTYWWCTRIFGYLGKCKRKVKVWILITILKLIKLEKEVV